jgi:hypothetical protein
LCGHNAKEFDIPFIENDYKPNCNTHKLNLFGKKPWEIPHTLELWKFGDTSITPFKINVQSAWNTISKGDIGSQSQCFLCR